ncbi:bifunctional phosphoribosylaminoimidazolecarboxamide formyltransferase/IMP cyclohydrolase [Pediococcus acidilactici]|uniref:bifunctional phosphoribosylaminoimidazolecarboxamide formyltransferase/IMP cyclohydrolase n=1 Tax=Pediococcus acidilactici TaxID=1254 RepID=UPI001311A5F2|nr:bifunctional phosphoribosylaminoimidazolecarboxamide formyltransferase/IMP cyclohydrolase [Pediococcus acidilactici]KAF0341328.1 bifunctional phosphoribosylaminoimidazolecarboxamide formyltransferase/IMP cyclohydrolase [Pediococcus acidilactici]KAF0352857.1 bifunctional phosphoribosylaminoimidazolecarboxamide formyltransferase/IMP cyclohydrolase [Pediococcus acidilactici]KAF0356664.1 bifunctional phosphoribosylaminoimidazolecarboxamide formyltransferase/IMP cyclohydrolase [Pediococcus acidila
MKTALLSVSDKTGIVEFAKGLAAQEFRIVSTGGTKKVLEEAGLTVTGLEELTGFPELLDGRVKTLHPVIHGGLLARRDLPNHLQALKEQQIGLIDLVCVNLYPFKSTIMQDGITEAEAIEQIDIGGPSMLRSAAKNFASVWAVADPADYQAVLDQLAQTDDAIAFRRVLALKVFQHTAAYDTLIAQYLGRADEEFPTQLTMTYTKKQVMRYGENSHQKAAFYENALPVPFSIAQAKQLHGKELSYNNIKDADAALKMSAEFEQPTVIAVKHMNPCGIGLGKSIEEAWDRAYAADPISIFGGIIVLNRPVDLATAQKMHQLFLEIIIAPSFEREAFAVLAQKKNLRIMTVDFSKKQASKELETVSVMGGLLVQEPDEVAESQADFKVVSKRQPTEAELRAMVFGQTVVKHVKSNAIVIATENQTLGIGAGQMNRIGSVEIAIEQAEKAAGFKNAIMASDAFFPMDDCVEFAAKHGIKVIVEPGGSIKDQASIDKADELGITLVFSGRRHFRH